MFWDLQFIKLVVLFDLNEDEVNHVVSLQSLVFKFNVCLNNVGRIVLQAIVLKSDLLSTVLSGCLLD